MTGTADVQFWYYLGWCILAYAVLVVTLQYGSLFLQTVGFAMALPATVWMLYGAGRGFYEEIWPVMKNDIRGAIRVVFGV